MREFDPNDLEMQSWIAENVLIIEKKLLKIKAIQDEIKFRS
jgi:hypothetical protein